MSINEGELLAACENFHDSWFGGKSKEHKEEFSDLLYRFVRCWQQERESSRESQHIEMLHGDERRKQQMKTLVEENNRLREALFPRPEIKDCSPLILYFGTKEERDEFVALVGEAKPNMRSYKV